ncbi:MAG: aspartate-semialdehyde dehydrogenase [Methanomassiliicoccales archaeon]|nr:aspartate-semialdehyde dehydrogenase [Methanomassiliicoccales archaeon]
MRKMEVAVLGATGMIGQRFIQLLEEHPYFEIKGLYASERSEGKRLADVLKLKDHIFKDETLDAVIEQISPRKISKECRLAFSGLPSDIAKDYEASLATEGVPVFSNASSHRMRADVPVLIPEVNSPHLDLVKTQNTHGGGGFIVTNPNCSATGLAIPLKAIDNAYALDMVVVTTFQAVSGAGYPGVPSIDILGNVIPYIKNEEEKMEMEILKMLGRLEGKSIVPADFTMLANCARVPVADGHLESVTMTLREEPTVEELKKCLSEFRAEPQRLKLPIAPRVPIIVRHEENRPQPLMDANAGQPGRARGMAVTVGRLRKTGKFYKMFILSHNTIRGGAGGSVSNAELAYAKQLLK